MNWVKEYYRRIECGDIVTSKRVRAVYSRLVAEMDAANDDSPYYFDEETGERPILFIETFCKQSQGTIGAPLELELFQKAYMQLLFGWLEKETGYRRFRETMFLCGRKNGKSTLLSGIALYMLIADYEGAAEIYSVATKKDQAKKVLTEAVNMVKQSPELRAVVKKRRNDIYFPATSSIFEALASDSNTLDGLNSHAVIIDELHAIRDRNLYEVMKQSTSSRRQPLVVMITTAGTVRECIFDNMYELAADLADGKKKDDTFLPILYELDSRDEWTNPQMWIKANPGLGKIKQYKTLANFVERAKNSPADLPGVLCKDFNIRENESPYGFPLSRLKTRRRLLLTTFTIPTLSAVATSRLQPTLQQQRCLYASRTTKRFTFCSSIFYHKPALNTSRRKTQTRHPIGYGRSGACLRYARAAA